MQRFLNQRLSAATLFFQIRHAETFSDKTGRGVAGDLVDERVGRRHQGESLSWSVVPELAPRGVAHLRHGHGRFLGFPADQLVQVVERVHLLVLAVVLGTVIKALVRVQRALLERDRVVVLVRLARQYDVVLVRISVHVQRIDADVGFLDGRKQQFALANLRTVHPVVTTNPSQVQLQPGSTGGRSRLTPVVVPVPAVSELGRVGRQQRVNVLGAEALHVDLGQVRVDVLRQVLVVGQLADAVVGRGQRRQDALVGDAIAVAAIIHKPLIVGVVVAKVLRGRNRAAQRHPATNSDTTTTTSGNRQVRIAVGVRVGTSRRHLCRSLLQLLTNALQSMQQNLVRVLANVKVVVVELILVLLLLLMMIV
uniref:(northern house mosquito) hypothetical protein n=1 Tax=Culex pipiens TaxID=7175 RepID=A0A8D8NNN7_CULPI